MIISLLSTYTMNDFFSVELFDYGEAQEFNSFLQSYGTDLFGSEAWGDISSPCPDANLYQEKPSQEVVQLMQYQQEPFSNFGLPNHDHPDVTFPLNEVSLESKQESEKEKPNPISATSLKLLNKYGKGQKMANGSQAGITNAVHYRLSTNDVMMIAGSWYIQSSSQIDDDVFMSQHPLSCAKSNHGDDRTKDVQLVFFLLVAAGKVSKQQFYQASNVLTQFDHLSANAGNPIEKLVYFFSQSLHERINREVRRTSLSLLGKVEHQVDLEQAMMSLNPFLLGYHQELPFSKVIQFSGIQTIIDSVAFKKKVHVIDLGVRTGMHWTILIQALASRYENPVEFLKITAVGKSEQQANMEATGQRLLSFADTMKLNFSFRVIVLSDMKEFKEDLFMLEADEAVVVHSPVLLRILLPWPDRLEALLAAISRLKPCVMVVTEMEGNYNSSFFDHRFAEALFFYSALLDCIEASRNENNEVIMDALEANFGVSIMNIVATEGEERTTRCVGLNVWRLFFARFGMVETKLSKTSLFQADLILKQFSIGSHCTLDMNGECLIVGWKGTPIHSVSAWKFQ